MAENDIEAGFRAITGDVGVDVVCVDVGCASSWFSPGMSCDSLVTPRPLVEVPLVVDDFGAATAETGTELDEREVVGLETAPANEKDAVGAVVVIDVVFAGAGAVVEEGAGAGASAGTRAEVVELTD